MAVTVHDMIPWAFGGWRMLGERFRHRVARRLLPRAEMIFAVSQSTQADLLRLGGVEAERIRVVYEGVDPVFKPRDGAAERNHRRWGLAGPYLLFVGALDVRKDPRGLLRAWRTATAGGAAVELVVAGEPGRQAPAEMGGARLLGHVSTEEMVDLLSDAGCLLFPSLYEGFGLPVLEAMACGCPVVAYRNSSLPEVVGDAGVLVSNGDAEALGQAAAELVLNPKRRAELVRKGRVQAHRFSWKNTASRDDRGLPRLACSGRVATRPGDSTLTGDGQIRPSAGPAFPPCRAVNGAGHGRQGSPLESPLSTASPPSSSSSPVR